LRQVGAELQREAIAAQKSPKRVYGYAHYGWYQDDVERPTKGDKFVRLDTITHGTQRNKMIYLGGRPKSGKSMLLAGILPNLAEQCPPGEMIRLISLEMSAGAYVERMASILSGVTNASGIHTGYIDPDELVRYCEAVEYISSLPLEIIDKATLNEISGIISNKDVPTYLWALDNFGLISGTEHRDIGSAANVIQQLCQHVATGIIIGHLNRASVGKRPTMESIAGSDQLGRNFDEAWLLWKVLDGLEIDPSMIEDGEAAELVVISRASMGGIDHLWWDKKTASFSEMTPEQVEAMPAPAPAKKGKVA
jgi:DnaB helicase-like protein